MPQRRSPPDRTSQAPERRGRLWDQVQHLKQTLRAGGGVDSLDYGAVLEQARCARATFKDLKDTVDNSEVQRDAPEDGEALHVKSPAGN
jgi:hypothetical protein